jgi:hypothetical protein
MRIRDGKIRIRDKLPGSATLVVSVAKGLQNQTGWHTKVEKSPRNFYLSLSRFLSSYSSAKLCRISYKMRPSSVLIC